MQLVLVLVNRHQSRRAAAVSSGPLSHRRNSGQRPLATVTLSKHTTGPTGRSTAKHPPPTPPNGPDNTTQNTHNPWTQKRDPVTYASP